jgi:hypothetical protein
MESSIYYFNNERFGSNKEAPGIEQQHSREILLPPENFQTTISLDMRAIHLHQASPVQYIALKR